MVKAVVVYHGVDLDGVSSAALAVLAYGKNNVALVPANYDQDQMLLIKDIKKKISDFGANVDVVILDYSLLPEVMDDFASMEEVRKVRWYDHHKSAILRYLEAVEEPQEKYKNSDGSYSVSVLDGKKDYYCTTKCCGAFIYWEMLKNISNGEFRNFLESEPIGIFYTYVTIFDTWMSETEKFKTACKMNLGCQKYISPEGVFALAKFLSSPDFSEESIIGLIIEGNTIQTYMDKKNSDWAQRAAFDVEFEGMKFCAVNATPGGSFVVESAATSEHDALMSFQLLKTKEWAISLYHNPKSERKPDLSIVAKKYGGGGHPGACGFKMKNLPFLE